MLYLIALLCATSAALVIVGVAQLLPARSGGVARRLAELEHSGENPFGVLQRRQRQARRDRWEAVLQHLGERLSGKEENAEISAARQRMIQAGLQNPNAAAIYTGTRIVLPLGLGLIGLVFIPSFGGLGLILVSWLAAIGWIVPSFWVDGRIRRRQSEIRRALADALDLMITCVEAGLGINQTLMKVADEIRYVSTTLSSELMQVNFEIRAGRPREEALRDLAERTGVDDVRELTTMLIQADRFGTSISQGLRVHSETLRVKRRQRAEEAAAKTSIKILFPVLICIFPGLFVVIIGPAAIRIYESLIGGVFGG
jgi:tight adherence protein C